MEELIGTLVCKMKILYTIYFPANVFKQVEYIHEIQLFNLVC